MTRKAISTLVTGTALLALAGCGESETVATGASKFVGSWDVTDCEPIGDHPASGVIYRCTLHIPGTGTTTQTFVLEDNGTVSENFEEPR